MCLMNSIDRVRVIQLRVPSAQLIHADTAEPTRRALPEYGISGSCGSLPGSAVEALTRDATQKNDTK